MHNLLVSAFLFGGVEGLAVDPVRGQVGLVHDHQLGLALPRVLTVQFLARFVELLDAVAQDLALVHEIVKH